MLFCNKENNGNQQISYRPACHSRFLEILQKEKVRLIIQGHKQSGYLENFFTFAVDAVVARAMMREQKTPIIEQEQRVRKLIDERTTSLQVSEIKRPQERPAKKRRSGDEHELWNRRKYTAVSSKRSTTKSYS